MGNTADCQKDSVIAQGGVLHLHGAPLPEVDRATAVGTQGSTAFDGLGLVGFPAKTALKGMRPWPHFGGRPRKGRWFLPGLEIRFGDHLVS